MNFLGRLMRLPLRLVPRGVTVPILTGRLAGWKWVTGTATHGCWIGTYEREAQRVFERFVRAGDVVYDIGANVGFFTLLAARLGGTVYAFEPVPRNLALLRRHVQANRATSVQVLDLALSSSRGTARFSYGADAAMGRLNADGEVEVRTETIDALVESGELPPPAFMKMDVEGAEYDVLTGAAAVLERHRPRILLSTHGTPMHERCCALLRDARYDLEVVRDGRVDGHYTVVASPAEGRSSSRDNINSATNRSHA